MSIFSIASETKNLLAAISVAVCTFHSEPRILRYTKFDNDVDILAFADLLPRIPNGADVLIHLPELLANKYADECLVVCRSRSNLNWQFNILLQNIDLIPSRTTIEKLQQIGMTTATAAHKSYATDETAWRIGCPVHHLSTWESPEAFERIGYAQKQKLIMVSPDQHPARSQIVHQLFAALPDHQIVEIRNMPYRKYRKIARDAKFAFTFGEGLDGYFVETIFSGGVAMAIFNDRFFTNEYRNLDGVFPDAEAAILHVGEFLRIADDEALYQAIAERQYSTTARNYVRAEYLQNIKEFYEKYFPAGG